MNKGSIPASKTRIPSKGERYGGLPYIPLITPLAQGFEQLADSFGEFSSHLFGVGSIYDDGLNEEFDRILNQSPEERLAENFKRLDENLAEVGKFLLTATIESAQKIGSKELAQDIRATADGTWPDPWYWGFLNQLQPGTSNVIMKRSEAIQKEEHAKEMAAISRRYPVANFFTKIGLIKR